MFKKSLIIATALFASVVAFQPVEQAEAKVSIGIGIGIPGVYGPGYYGGGYAPAPYYGHGGYYAPRRSYRLSCGQVRRKLRNRGYYRIRAKDCSGSRYTFHAKRGGEWFRLRIKSNNGRIYKRTYL